MLNYVSSWGEKSYYLRIIGVEWIFAGGSLQAWSATQFEGHSANANANARLRWQEISFLFLRAHHHDPCRPPRGLQLPCWDALNMWIGNGWGTRTESPWKAPWRSSPESGIAAPLRSPDVAGSLLKSDPTYYHSVLSDRTSL